MDNWRVAPVPALDKMYFGQAFTVGFQRFRNLSFEMNRQCYATQAVQSHREGVRRPLDYLLITRSVTYSVERRSVSLLAHRTTTW